MSVLPLSSPTFPRNGSPNPGPIRSAGSLSNRVPVMFRRLTRFQQMVCSTFASSKAVVPICESRTSSWLRGSLPTSACHPSECEYPCRPMQRTRRHELLFLGIGMCTSTNVSWTVSRDVSASLTGAFTGRNEEYMGKGRPRHYYSHLRMLSRQVFSQAFKISFVTQPSVSAIAWSVVYSYTPFQVIQLALLMIIRDYLFVGALIATLLWCVIIHSLHMSH